MTRVGIIVVVCLCLAPLAHADVGDDLQEAAEALTAGEYRRAAQIAADIVHRGGELDRADRAEGWRVYGLALFMQGRADDAERALLEYLKLEPDAVLDPALVPPEAVRFFEDVRAKHADEIARYRPRPPRKRSALMNLVPPLGQFQNGHRTKGWVIAGVGTTLIAVSLSSYLVFDGWCDDATGVCESGSGPDAEDKTSAARALRTVNLVSTAALVGLYVYGVWDGYSNHRDITRSEQRATVRQWSAIVAPTSQGAVFVLGRRF